jgi:tetratricopeptide (TPR) repeat protein
MSGRAAAAADRKRGEVLADMGRNREAIPFLQRAIAAQPDHVWTHCRLAHCFEQLGLVRESLRQAEHALTLDPSYEWAHRLRGVALFRRGSVVRAVEAFREAVRVAPGSAWSRIGFNEVAHYYEYRLEARAMLAEAIRIDPEHFGARWGYARAQDDPVAKIEAWHEVLRLRPDNAWAQNALGFGFWKNRQLDEAEACFRRALAAGPGGDQQQPVTDLAAVNLAKLLRYRGNEEAANELLRRTGESRLSRLDQILRDHPNEAWVHRVRAQWYWALGRHDDAYREIQQLVRVEPTNPSGWQWLSVWAGRRGHTQVALYAARRAEALDDSTSSLFPLLTALHLAGRSDEAHTVASKIGEIAKGTEVVPYAYGIAALTNEDFPEAERQLAISFERDPVDCCFATALAYAQLQAGNHTRAQQTWQTARRLTVNCNCSMVQALQEAFDPRCG